MKQLTAIMLFCALYACNTPAQNYYPDKVNDTAFYLGNTNYRDYLGQNKNYTDTVLVIRKAKDSIVIIAPYFMLYDHYPLKVKKMHGNYTFHISNNKQYPYRDSLVGQEDGDSIVIRRNHSLYDFSVPSKLDIKSSDKYHQDGLTKRFKEYEFIGKRRFIR